MVVMIASGCGTLERRQAPGETVPTQIGQPSAPPAPVAVPGPGTPPAPPAQQAPTFLSKELPKVGIILGPGGMKSYAHIGVLKELARARVPIHAVAGLEWGAVIGGLYSMQGQVNEAEWKAFKLRESDLPSASGFLSSRLKPQAITSLNEFLDTVFANSSIDRAKVEFGCPAYWTKADRFGWMAKGSYKEAMRACLPYPPLYTDAGVVASPFSVSESVTWLRSQGANLIVLVDVLSQGDATPAKLSSEDHAQSLLWSEIRREMQRAKPLVNHVITVNTSGHPITDYNGRRALMESGSKAAGDIVNKMVSQYGF